MGKFKGGGNSIITLINYFCLQKKAQEAFSEKQEAQDKQPEDTAATGGPTTYESNSNNAETATNATADNVTKVPASSELSPQTADKLSNSLEGILITEINKVSEEPVEAKHNETDLDEDTPRSDDYKKAAVKRKTGLARANTVSPNRLATLESLSYEIMTSTLPINKMKRILPEERTPVQERWPILSNYRKQNVLPSVKRGKKRLTHDMSELHTKINEYFDCDNFPLWQYKYVPKQQHRKYRLLKAIETESLSLPIIPKHD